ncbi:MAG: DUF4268 domain-containing protein [Xanthobacteraceae bacterium]|nr:DUF4268 domain-containing protein [Xanthobacteraceae bacterium]
MTLQLGRLTPVNLREVWRHEANEFTPWLALPDNMALLAETLGLGELSVQGTEVPVGNFKIDILAQNLEGDVVVIENQFGATDHTHLGQIMTYVAGREGAATVIWIAESFREEHRAAIDWLNASTIEGFNFFAVEIEALRIGDSLPAPRFNIVGKPNEFTRDVTRTTRQVNQGPRSELQQSYFQYWSEFKEYLAANNSKFSNDRDLYDYWCGFRIGRSGIQFAATASIRDKLLCTQLYISRSDNKATYRALERDKAKIEREFGGALEWEELPGRTASRIAVYKNSDPAINSDRPQQFAWMSQNLDQLRRVFLERVKNIIDEVETADE